MNRRAGLHLIDRHGHLALPAWMAIRSDAGKVHGIDLTRQVVERDADERRRRSAEEFVDRAAKLGVVVRHARRWQDPLAREPREQCALLLITILSSFVERSLALDEAHLCP